MNHLETGVSNATTTAEAAIPKPASPASNDGLVWNGSTWVNAKLVNANIDPAAAIAYSKLQLAGSVVNNDVATSAAIAYSKLNLASSVKFSDMATLLADAPASKELLYVEFTGASITTTGTTFASGTQVVSAGAFTFDGATKVRVEFFAPNVFSSTTAQNVQLSLADGGTGGTDLGIIGIFSNTTNVPGYVVREFTPPNAAKTYSIVMWMSGAGTATIQAGAGGAGTKMPGYIRITKV